jgi:hypothetical protein
VQDWCPFRAPETQTAGICTNAFPAVGGATKSPHFRYQLLGFSFDFGSGAELVLSWSELGSTVIDVA